MQTPFRRLEQRKIKFTTGKLLERIGRLLFTWGTGRSLKSFPSSNVLSVTLSPLCPVYLCSILHGIYCRVPGQVSRMPRRAPDPVPRCAGLSNQCHPAAISGTPHRNHGRASRPDQRANNGTLQRLLGKSLLHVMRALWKENLSWL